MLRPVVQSSAFCAFLAFCNFISVADAATSGSMISSVSPNSVCQGSTNTYTFSGSPAQNDLMDFKAPGSITAGDCGSLTGDAITIPAGAPPISLTLSLTAGSYKLCYRDVGSGETDLIEQTTASLSVVAATPDRISSISPVSISNNFATSFTFTTPVTGDLVELSSSATCSGATPATSIGGGSGTLTVAHGGSFPATYYVCLRQTGCSDATVQTATVTVVDVTPQNRISAMTPTSIVTSSSAQTINFVGQSAGDLAIFSTSSSCAGAYPSVDISGGSGSFTFTNSGTYYLCLRASGGSDASVQSASGTILTVSGTGGVLGDPLTYFGEKRAMFIIPYGVLTPLLLLPDASVFAEPVRGEQEDEQWLGRIVVKGKDGTQLVQVDIKDPRDLLAFNRTDSLVDNSFETLNVYLGPNSDHLPSLPASNEMITFGNGMSMACSRVRDGNAEKAALQSPYLPRREGLLLVTQQTRMLIMSSSASEWHGHSSTLGFKHAHLDFELFDMQDAASWGGLLPELWGVKPMSEMGRLMLKGNVSVWEEAEPLTLRNDTL